MSGCFIVGIELGLLLEEEVTNPQLRFLLNENELAVFISLEDGREKIAVKKNVKMFQINSGVKS